MQPSVFGSASLEIGGGVVIGALIAVNPFGDVYDPETGKIIAGTRSIHKGLINMGDEPIFANTKSFLKTTIGKTVVSFASSHNTVIGVVATNARLDREETNFLAQMAQDGLPLAIRPAHTLFDGDTLFAISTGIAHVDVARRVRGDPGIRLLRLAAGRGPAPRPHPQAQGAQFVFLFSRFPLYRRRGIRRQ